jgi:ATP-binding cassette subfamily B protein/subfamily B ATP-binding cassette protein MsbA
MRKYRRLIRYAAREWPALLVILVLTSLYSVVATLQPWPMKLLVDYALGSGPGATPLAWLPELSTSGWILAAALMSLVLFLFNTALDAGLTWAWSAAGQRMVYDLAADLFHRLQRLSLLFHSRRSVGDSLSRLTGDTWCIYTVTEGLLVAPLQNLLQLVTIGTVAWAMDPTLALLTLAVAPLLGASALLFGQPLKRRTRFSREAQARLLSFVHQTLGAIPMVQAFDTAGRNRRRFDALATETVAVAQRQTVIKTIYEMVNGLTVTLGTAVVLLVGGRRVLDGTLSLGSLLVFMGYLRSLHGACRGLMGIYSNMKTSEASLDRVNEILDTGDEVPEAPDAKPLPDRAPGVGGSIRFESVTFGYARGVPVLRDISLEARPGETIALVGTTGAGKSTLVSLIPRLFDPWSGRILFDGMELRQARVADVRARVAVVLQDPFLLPLSISQNIAYGRPGAPAAEIEAAARSANAHEFIERLPQGYETVLGERGATLSGGQRQRLAIARAFLMNAPVLILDEPTAALDAGTEELLLEALHRLQAGRTTFIIAHRLSTIRHADKILLLDQGRIAESGRHAELLARQGAYYHLCQRQFAAGTTSGEGL